MKTTGLCMILILLQGCTHFDPFVSFRPLFAGLDEAALTDRARGKLAEAKFDFEMARKGRPPHYARLINHDPRLGTKNYQGSGYQLTVFEGGPRHRVGQRILIEPAITGDRPYHYDESHEQWD